MPALFNEIDPKAAAWLRELIQQGHIAAGEVDERSIEDIAPDDLRRFRSVHLFAGIGVWSYALRLAGWPDDRSVWTCSCPCQPFSSAGKGGGFGDERHLWPAAFHLVRECRPGVLFGEQVASDDGLAWLDLVQADLEAIGYTVGAVVTPAAGFGAPHQRHRTYFVGESKEFRASNQKQAGQPHASRNGATDAPVVGHADNGSVRQHRRKGSTVKGKPKATVLAQTVCGTGGVGNPDGGIASNGRLQRGGEHGLQPKGSGPALAFGVAQGDTEGERPQGQRSVCGSAGTRRCRLVGLSGEDILCGFWRDSEWLYCNDEKYRAVEPGTFPLAHGATNRVVKLRGFGNGLVATQAASFIQAYRWLTE